MKHAIIIALVCLNVALVMGLVFSANRAEAQVGGGAGDYLMLTGHVQNDVEVLYVVNSTKGLMLALAPKTVSNAITLQPVAPTNLKRDFGVAPK